MRIVINSVAVLGAICALTSVGAQAVGPERSAAIRVGCEGPAANSSVFVNDQFKGDCPLDVLVAPGDIRLRVVRKTNARQEQVFTEEFRMTANTVRRVTVELGPPQVSREVRQAEDRLRADLLVMAKALQMKALTGDARAALEAAGAYRSLAALNRGHEDRDPAEGAEWSKLALDLEEISAQVDLPAAAVAVAGQYELGSALRPRDRNRAFGLYRAAAEAGSPAAMGALGAMYANGWGTTSDDRLAVQWLQKGADAGDGRAMSGLSAMHRGGRGGLTANSAAASEWLAKAVDKGDPRALVSSGMRYRNGDGVARDLAQALRFFEAAAPRHPPAQFLVGRAYYNGEGTGRDLARAARELEAAALAGNEQAMYLYGLMNQDGGGGLVPNDAQAVVWFRKAAELGDTTALRALGAYHERGRGGLARNRREALAYYRKAGELGDPIGAAMAKALHETWVP